ncbi:MAG: type II toxin-antitoxin system VapC family toxin [Armatimonadetes bacterium]|nr:type II toxin-antitoxin system VapC family toxin [Armatimonadota bacterium]
MSIFIDTPAFYAILDSADANHEAARKAWLDALQQEQPLVTSNYVVVETAALLQRRIGLAAVRKLQEDILPVISIVWVDEATHSAGMSAVLAAGKRDLSLVDSVSFAILRRHGIREVLGFDSHFAEQGFVLKP